MRSDVDHQQQRALALKVECVPKIRPSSAHFIQEVINFPDKGEKTKKYFLVSKPKDGVIMQKVSNTCKLYSFFVKQLLIDTIKDPCIHVLLMMLVVCCLSTTLSFL